MPAVAFRNFRTSAFLACLSALIEMNSKVPSPVHPVNYHKVGKFRNAWSAPRCPDIYQPELV